MAYSSTYKWATLGPTMMLTSPTKCLPRLVLVFYFQRWLLCNTFWKIQGKWGRNVYYVKNGETKITSKCKPLRNLNHQQQNACGV